jgi:hypothetical protein
MSAPSKGRVERTNRGDFFIKTISPDSSESRQPKFYAAAIFFIGVPMELGVNSKNQI